MENVPVPGVDFIGISTSFYCVDAEGYILLHRRSANCRDHHGAWDCGGGRHEDRITIEENVLKEVLEEYGCQGEIIDRLPAYDVFSQDSHGRDTHWLALPHIIRVVHSEARLMEPDKADEIGWFTLSTLPTHLHPGMAVAVARYRTEIMCHVRV
jgi:8-oxo-dGTP diphosphatase